MPFLADGLTSKQIAPKLGISHRTVEVNRAKLLRKFAVTDTRALFQTLGGGRTEHIVPRERPASAARKGTAHLDLCCGPDRHGHQRDGGTVRSAADAKAPPPGIARTKQSGRSDQGESALDPSVAGASCQP